MTNPVPGSTHYELHLYITREKNGCLGFLQTHAFTIHLGICLTILKMYFMSTLITLSTGLFKPSAPSMAKFYSKTCSTQSQFLLPKTEILELKTSSPHSCYSLKLLHSKSSLELYWHPLILSGYNYLFLTEIVPEKFTNNHLTIPVTLSLLSSSCDTMGQLHLEILLGFFNFRFLSEQPIFFYICFAGFFPTCTVQDSSLQKLYLASRIQLPGFVS